MAETDLGGGEKSQTQTRFKFYNAEEVNKAESHFKNPHSSRSDKEPIISNRFNFYNAEEMHRTAPLHLPTPIDLTSLDAKSNDPRNSTSIQSTETADDSTTENILRSLQETEREHQQKAKSGGNRLASRRIIAARQQSNPYEAAIRDALAMLRTSAVKQPHHQSMLNTNPSSDDKILEFRETAWSEIREAEQRDRDERMAKYAAKLVELEGRPVPRLPLTQQNEENIQVALPVNQPHIENVFRDVDDNDQESDELREKELLQRAVSHTDRSQVSVDEEIQRGVERILMAILDRAQSRDETAREDTDSNDELTTALSSLLHTGTNFDMDPPRIKPPSRRLAEEYLTDDEGKDDDDEEDERTLDEYDVSQASVNKRSVVEELLAEEGDDNHHGAPPRVMEMAVSPQTIFSKLTNEQGIDDEEDEEDGPARSDFAAISHEDEDILIRRNNGTKVLGPLSGNDKTGVVLENSDTIIEDDDEPDEEVAAATSQGPPSILESLSSVVKDAENFMSYISGAVSPTNSSTKKDKDLVHNGDDDCHESFDTEANELMRSLCAHLMPYGVDKSTKHLSEIPPWDDRNPNEPGYRIIRLSKSQLCRVEQEFERMVNGVKLNSERDLGKMRLTEADSSTAWNGAMACSYDENFEKDLEEAENLLDREEKLRAVAERSTQAKRLSDDETDDDNETGHSETSASEDDDTTLTCHHDFPGVRRSGKGEMGDLEYFNLPIIFKSHVTGFEPTKDLFLEPGNVVAGQYLVESELGSAAFSTAYRCIDLNSDSIGDGEFREEVCLKVIKNTKDFFDQSLDEIKILELLRQTGKCNENNIVEMKCFFYHREHLIIVTELLRQNLFEFGKFIIDNNVEPYFTRRRLCYITRQVLVALNFVHSLGLVHSDVKPENILLSSYSRAKVKLIDFGSSCYLTDRQSSYIQSRSYRAPEVVLGLPYDGKIDIWSLGCVVAEMYTGEVTFQNDSIVSMLSRIEAICGPFPRHMIAQGRQSNRFFTKSGLLYELVVPDESRTNPVHDDNESGLFDVFQPKRTTLASRLGLDPKAVLRPSTEAQDQALFVDFCRSLLTIDPDSRPTAAQALQHPWIVAGASLTEEDVKYQ